MPQSRALSLLLQCRYGIWLNSIGDRSLSHNGNREESVGGDGHMKAETNHTTGRSFSDFTNDGASATNLTNIELVASLSPYVEG
jgi:hypothetical protein